MRVFLQEGIISLQTKGMARLGRHDIGFFFQVPLEAFHYIIGFYQSVLRHKFLPIPANSLLWVTDKEPITNLGSEHRITEPGRTSTEESKFIRAQYDEGGETVKDEIVAFGKRPTIRCDRILQRPRHRRHSH